MPHSADGNIEMHIGLSSYTWPWAVGREGHEPKNPLNTLTLLEKTRDCGISVLQIADNPALHLMAEDDLAEIKRTADSFGITMEVGTRGIEPDHLIRYLEIAEMLHSNIVRTITHDIDHQAVSWMRKVLSEYEKAGISIALENHDEHRTGALAAFINRLESPNVGVCLDTVNSFAALEAPEQVVRNLAPYTLNLHIKDFEVVRFGSELGFSIVGRPAGEGRLDVEWTVGYLRDKGRDPNLILELWTPFTETIEKTIALEEEWSKKSLKYLKSLSI
jgi:sugar phosphate isomerase/epimerase